MGIKTKASVKALFETGDVPTQADFASHIDSGVFIPAAGATGVIEVESTASSTSRAVGAFGVQMLAADTTAAANDLLAIAAATSVAHSTFGIAWVSAASTAAAQEIIGQPTFSAFGRAVASAATTAAGQLVLGGGTVGIQVYESATTAAAVAALGSPGGAWEFIETITPSDSATVDFESFDSAKYTSYMCVIEECVLAAGNAIFRMRYGTGGGPTYSSGSTYDSGAGQAGDDAAGNVTDGLADQNACVMGGPGMAAVSDDGMAGTITLHNAHNAAINSMLTWQWTVTQDTSDDLHCVWGGGRFHVVTDLTGWRFLNSSGNITSAKFHFYGLTQ